MEVEEEVMKLIDAAKGLEAEAETTESESQRSDLLEEVTKLYQNATELAEHHWGLYIDNTLRTRDLWATSLKEAGQIGSAITCDLVSVERYTKSPAHGSKHEQTLDAQRRLAQSYGVLGQHKEAVEIFRSIVSKCSKSNREIETWCDDRSNLADALFKSPDIKDVQEAVDISFATLQRCEKYFGEDHMRTCDVRFNLGAEFQKLKKYIDALDHFQKNWAILTRDTCQCKSDPSYEGLMDVLKKSIRKCERSIARQVKKEREEREAQDAKEKKEQEITPKGELEVKQKDDTKEEEDAKASKGQGTELQQPHEDSPDTEKRDQGAENEEQQRGDIEEQRIREDDAQRASNESELKAKEKAEREAALERERKAQEEKDRISREEAAARKAQEERERRAREEAERAAKEEADRKAREEAERTAREEAERIVREEAERKAQEESERKAQALAQEEEDRKAQEEAERKAREEESERKAREAADRIAREAAERKAEEEREREAMLERERLENEERERQAKEEREKAAKKEKEAQAFKEQEAYVKAEQERERIEKQRQDEAERLRLEQLDHQKRQEELEREGLLMEARRIEKPSADSQPQPLDSSNHSQIAEQTSQDEIPPMQQYLPGVWVTNTNVDTRTVEDLSSNITPKDLSTERTTPDHQSENSRTVEPTDEAAGLHTDPPIGDCIVTGPGSEYNAMASRSIQDAPTASNKHHQAPTTPLTNSILKTFALATSTVTGIATLRPPVSNRGTRSHSVGHTKRKSMPVDLGKIKDKGTLGDIQRDPRIDDHHKEQTVHTPNLSLSPVVPYVRRKSVDETRVPGGWPTVSDDREAVKSDPNLLNKSAPPEINQILTQSRPAAMTDSWFKKLRNETHKLLDKYKGHVHPGLKSRTVKIAILDTGIARTTNAPPMIKLAASRIKTVKTATNPLKPFEDTDGHGTHAAGLILKTCPYADLYVYRVAERDDFFPEIVAEALTNAIDVKQVDIVREPQESHIKGKRQRGFIICRKLKRGYWSQNHCVSSEST
ncbi:hypothetical protein BU24DRAFT_453060, partial [Aaosphaeria arxii CBS 175.79]